MTDAADRRAHPRVPCQMEVVLRMEDGSEVRAVSQDISLKGLFLKTDLALPMGAHCKVHLELVGPAGMIPLEAEGFIARVGDDGIGLEFDEVTKSAFAFLRRMSPFRTNEEAGSPAQAAALQQP
jgi:hypothetical protein